MIELLLRGARLFQVSGIEVLILPEPEQEVIDATQYDDRINIESPEREILEVKDMVPDVLAASGPVSNPDL